MSAASAAAGSTMPPTVSVRSAPATAVRSRHDGTPRNGERSSGARRTKGRPPESTSEGTQFSRVAGQTSRHSSAFLDALLARYPHWLIHAPVHPAW